MFFDWKIQLEKIQLTRDLSDNTMIYQGIRLPCKNDQGYFDPTTRTQATIVWFPEDKCIKESLSFIKIKYISLTHFQDEHISGIPQSHVDQKIAKM